MPKKNILFVIDERKMGGVCVLLRDFVNLFDSHKYNLDILCLHNNGEMLEDLGDKAHLFYGTPYFSSVDYSLKEVLKSKNIKRIYYKLKLIFDMKTGLIKKSIIRERKKIITKKYDLEIAFKDGFTALFTAYGDTPKKIHWLHYEYVLTNPCGNYPNAFRDAFPAFDKIVAVSNGVMDAFNNLYHQEDKTIVIDNLVNTDRIMKLSKEKSDLSLDSKNLNAICLGRLHHQKGYPRLIDALGKLKQENCLPANFQLRLIGDGPERSLIEKKIVEYDLTEKVILMGQVSNPYQYLKEFDFFILPSLYEPFGLVIVESLSLGVPVLACENAATGKLIENTKTGRIVPNSETGLYEGLKEIFTNPSVLKKYKKNLQNYKYDNQKIIDKIEELFDNETNDKKQS